MYAQAVAELEKAVTLSDRQDIYLATLASVLGASGRKQEARKLLRELQNRCEHRYVSYISLRRFR